MTWKLLKKGLQSQTWRMELHRRLESKVNHLSIGDQYHPRFWAFSSLEFSERELSEEFSIWKISLSETLLSKESFESFSESVCKICKNLYFNCSVLYLLMSILFISFLTLQFFENDQFYHIYNKQGFYLFVFQHF